MKTYICDGYLTYKFSTGVEAENEAEAKEKLHELMHEGNLKDWFDDWEYNICEVKD